MSLLAARGVIKRFGGVTALDGVELEAQPGRTLGLLGANGSGKSTLSKIIAGELAPDGGRITFDGREVAHASPHEAAARGIVIAHQHPSLAPDLPVWENVTCSLIPRAVSARRRRATKTGRETGTPAGGGDAPAAAPRAPRSGRRA
jgi:ABC-type sugar transport system ATPase subunit